MNVMTRLLLVMFVIYVYVAMRFTGQRWYVKANRISFLELSKNVALIRMPIKNFNLDRLLSRENSNRFRVILRQFCSNFV